MTSLYEFLSSSIATDLAQSLLHSLWQALTIALFLLFALKGVSGSHSRWRYRLALLSIVAVVLSWIGTFSILRHDASPNIAPASQQNHTAQPSVQTETAPQTPTPARQTTASTTVQTIHTTPAARPKTIGLGYGWLIPAWFVGVVLMTARIFIAMAGASRHKRKATPIKDPALVTLLKNLCTRMDVKRKIQFAATRTLNHPSVIGFWKPMLLIPASMLTGTPLSDLEAIIAHELAHIRRHDYLINLGQMIIESIFFFNPAVWWISRQIRIEREACCDLLGIDATGRRADYAKVLVDEFARTSSLPLSEQPAVAMGFGNDNKSSTERIRRIIHPRQNPTMKIGSVRLALLIGIAALALAALSKTADLTVEAAAKILTPKERVEKLIELARETETTQQNRHNSSSHEEIMVSGTIKTFEGKPLPKNTRIDSTSYNKEGRTSGYCGMRVNNQSQFKQSIPHLGTVIITATAEGYAPALSKPYDSTQGENIEQIELTLHSGFPLNLNIVDTDGNPIVGARVDISFFHKANDKDIHLFSNSTKAHSNSEGSVKFEHMAELSLKINIEASGFQPIDHWKCRPKPGKTFEIVMQKGLISRGTVVAKETGEPIPNATFTLMRRSKPNHGWEYHGGKAAEQTDTQGRFTFNDLSPDTTYTYIVEAEGYNRVRLEKVDSETMPKRIELGPELYIRGTVIGDLEKLGRVCGNPHDDGFDKGFSYTSFMLKDGKRDYSRQDRGVVEVVVKDGIGLFELKNVIGDEISFYASQKNKAVVTTNGKSTDGIVIDMDSELVARNAPHREVMMIFKTPAGLPPAEGEISIWHATEQNRKRGDTSWSGMKIKIIDGVGRASFPAPGYIKLEGSQQLIGYWVEPESDQQANQRLIEPGTEPLEFSYTLKPAGGIFGNIFDDKGAPLSGMDMDIHPVFPERDISSLKELTKEEVKLVTEQFRKESALRNILRLPHMKSKNGTFAFTTLPLGYTYKISVRSEHTLLASEPITLTQENPIQEVALKHAPLKKVSGQVLMPDGSPYANIPARLKVRIMRHSYGNQAIQTDEEGYFEFAGLNPDPSVEYHLSIDTGAGWQPITTMIKPGTHQTYTLVKGLSIKGKVTDHETGLPLAGIMVATAKLADLKDMQEIYAETDSGGLFSFSTLAPGEYALGANNMALVSPSSTNGFFTTFTVGEIDFIELLVKPMTNMPHFIP